MVDFQNKLK